MADRIKLELVDDPVTGPTPRAPGKTTSLPAVAADRIKLEVVDDPVTGPTPSVPGKTTSLPGAADSEPSPRRPSRQSNRSTRSGASAPGAARASTSRRRQPDGNASKSAAGSMPKNSGSASRSSRGSTGSRSSGASRTGARARGASTASSRRGAASANPKQGGSRPQTSTTDAARERPGESRDGQQQDEDHSTRAATIGLSVLTAAIGVAGGVLLGRTVLQRQRKVLGIPLPSNADIRLGGAGQKLGEAGHRFGKLADELRSVRERAEKIGGALT